MSRRRWFELPTARRTGVPASAALFHRSPGSAPDFSGGSYASFVAFAPDSTRALVLYPFEFEERAVLYVMNRSLTDGYRLVLDDSLHGSDTPKAVGWIDGAQAWVVVGYSQGTVSPGSDLFALSLETGAARLLWASPDSGRTQAVSFAPPSTVQLRMFDSNMDHPRDSTLVLPAAALAAQR